MSSFLLKFLPILALACILFSSCKSPQQEPDAETKAETKAETEPAPESPDDNNTLLIRLHAYQLGHLEFTEDISFQQAIDMLRLRYRDVDWATTKPVKSLTSRSKQDYAKFGNRKPGALVIKRMSMAEALDLICGRCGLKWKIEDGGVVFSEST